jgi:hypothetical protein
MKQTSPAKKQRRPNSVLEDLQLLAERFKQVGRTVEADSARQLIEDIGTLSQKQKEGSAG